MPSQQPTGGQKSSSKSKQIGGSHYTDMAIQPREYIIKNNLGWDEGMVVKYISRHKSKNGKEDLLKAIHCIELIIEDQYS